MKKWLLVATGGDPLDSLGTATIQTFTSGDGDQPEPGDLSAAILDLSDRYDRRYNVGVDAASRRMEVVLVPLDESRVLTLALDRTATLVSTGGPV